MIFKAIRRLIPATERLIVYQIVKKCIKENHWQVWWDGDMIFEVKGERAEFDAGHFADGLERGITGSKQKLGSKSRIKTKGWRDYLEAFDTYEDYRDCS